MSAPTTPEELEWLTDQLSAVFVSEEPEHGLINIGFLEYLGFEYGRHAALFADESDTYMATFTEDLEMVYVNRLKDREPPIVW